MTYAFDQSPCPRCGETAVADFVDNGVGMQQCGPFSCEACGWTEPPPFYPNGQPMFTPDGMMLDEDGNRSIFDDVDL